MIINTERERNKKRKGFMLLVGSVSHSVSDSKEPLHGSFSWLQAVDDDFSFLRREAAKWTTAAGLLSSYSINGSLSILHVEELLRGTQLHCQVAQVARKGVRRTRFQRAKSILEVASKDHVCLLHAGNAYRLGGGFTKGGPVGWEEALCMQSLGFS